MAGRKNKVTAADRLASVLVVACMAAVVAAADNQQASEAIIKFCGATGFKETCIKSVAHANSTKPKELMKAAFDSAVAEIQSAIKNTSTYKKVAADKLTRGALDVCEDVLNSSIFSVRRSFDNINSFEIGQMDHALDDAKVWLSAAITCKSTCIDAFAKTKGDIGKQVTQILKTSGELLSNGLAMVIEFQKLYQSLNLGELTDRINKQRQLLDTPTTMSLKPRVTVAQDGSGQFKTIQEAVNTVPVGNKEPFVIFVKAGVYKEYVFIPKLVDHVVLVGEGPLKTRISGSKSMTGGVPTYNSGTLIIEGESFMAKDIGIENTAGPDGEQAVAVRPSGDLGIFYNVHMDGYQDTLFAHSLRQLYRECRISGTVDFVFGNGISVFQKCELVVRKPNPGQGCMVTAQGRDEQNLTGVTIIQGCKFTAEQDFLDTKPPMEAYLGRPWKTMSRTIVMQSNIDGFISPLGWSPWKGTWALDTLFYVEYDNTGPGAGYADRVKWAGLHNFTGVEEARSWTAKPQFKWDEWVTQSGVPYDGGFMDKVDISNFFSQKPISNSPQEPISPQKSTSPKKTTSPKKNNSHKKKKKKTKS